MRRDPRIADTLTFRVLVAANRIAQPFAERVGARFDLTLPEWRCMMALAAEPGRSGEDVARMMSMDKMSVSRSLRRLAKSGRAEAQPDPANAKRNQWQLTAAGWEVFDAIVPSALARDEAAFARLDPEARRLVHEVLSGFLDPDPDNGPGS
jgi:DNA-binding MarR family transcriptional regulator